MDNKEIAKVLRNLIHHTKENQTNCSVNGLNIIKLRMVVDHLEAAVDLLDVQEPWA